RPLLRLRDLETLEIGYCSVMMDDDMLEMTAKALPNLQSLHLITGTRWDPPTITLQGLIPLLRYCPKLDTLRLSLNTERITDVLNRPGTGVRNTRISMLTLPDSPVGDPIFVAAFLVNIFPSLTQIKSEGGRQPPNEGWEQVELALKAIAIVRKSSTNDRNQSCTTGLI
ncbi:hypothetical protein F5I97DRAFT_1817059, partial [Phlebopus sp. FC_14]